MATSRLLVSIEANSAKLVTEVERSRKSIQGMSADLKLIKFDSIVNLGERAFQAGRQFYDFAKSVASAGNDIQRMSRVFNMSTDDFQKWSYVAKMADVDIEGFGNAFKFLTRSMSEALQGTGDAAKAFSLLGINLKDSSGQTKDQQTVMTETIGALEKYAEGVNRDALMLAIFGRGWMSIKPLVDQGTKAIEENRTELERLNGILGKDTIKSLSESEDAFKRWETTWKVAKSETFAPMVEIFGSILERIMALKRAWGEGGITGVFKEVMAGQEEERIRQLPAASWTKDWVSGWTPQKTPAKKEAPGMPSKTDQKAIEDEAKAWGDYADQRIEELTRLNTIQNEVNKQEVDRQEYAKNRIIEGAEEFERIKTEANTAVTESTMMVYESDQRLISVMTSLKSEYADLTGNTKLQIEADREHTELTIQRLGLYGQEAEAMRMVAAERQRQMTETYKFNQDMGKQLSSTMASEFTKSITSGQKFSDSMKNIFNNLCSWIVNRVLQTQLEKLFNVQGSGGGTNWGSIVGSVVGAVGGLLGSGTGGAPMGAENWSAGAQNSMTWLQEGGIVNKPMIAGVGDVPEAVIPLDKLEGSSKKEDQPPNVTNFNIMTLDVSTMEQWVRKNSKLFVDVNVDNIRRGGQLAKAVRGA